MNRIEQNWANASWKYAKRYRAPMTVTVTEQQPQPQPQPLHGTTLVVDDVDKDF